MTTLRFEVEARRVLPAHVAGDVVRAIRPRWRGARIYVRREALDTAPPDSALARFAADLAAAVADAGGDEAHVRTLLRQLASMHVLV